MPSFASLRWTKPSALGGDIYEGIYAAMLGPSYETPAEIRYLRTIGADLVGMSTVPEVIVARHMGIEVLAISCVTNMAAGMSGEKINHDEVLETGERVRGKFLALLRAVLPRIDAISRSLARLRFSISLATYAPATGHCVYTVAACRGSPISLALPGRRERGRAILPTTFPNACRRRCWRSITITATSRICRWKSVPAPTSTIPQLSSTSC